LKRLYEDGRSRSGEASLSAALTKLCRI